MYKIHLMKRNDFYQNKREFDLLVIGAGIFGLFAAWDAALRGLSVAIIDKNDFGHATSANHFKMIHGGIRYLQHGDFFRVREACRERSALLRIAPHLTQPLPIVIPTYGKGIKGKALLSIGMLIYDMLTFDRNRGLQKERSISNRKFISSNQVKDLFPEINDNELTGAGVFYDGQYYDSNRLAISILQSSIDAGAVAANYIEVDGFIKKKNRIYGVTANDLINNRQLQIHGKLVLNATGPWAHHLLKSTLGLQLNPTPYFSRDLALIVKRKMPHNYGLAFLTYSTDSQALVDRGSRHLFAVPWKEYTLIGVWPLHFEKAPEDIQITEKEIHQFIQEANYAYPGLKLSIDDIVQINAGLTLQGNNKAKNKQSFNYGSESLLIDHSLDHGIEGLITLIGLRATMARGMAERATNIIMHKLKKISQKCRTETTPVSGGDILSFNALLSDALRSRPATISPKSIEMLTHAYGSKYNEILAYCDKNPNWIQTFKNSNVVKAQVIHAIRKEMAQKLSDVIFRRTDLGAAGCPEDNVIRGCAEMMATEMGWNLETMEHEIEEVKNSNVWRTR